MHGRRDVQSACEEQIKGAAGVAAIQQWAAICDEGGAIAQPAATLAAASQAVVELGQLVWVRSERGRMLRLLVQQLDQADATAREKAFELSSQLEPPEVEPEAEAESAAAAAAAHLNEAAAHSRYIYDQSMAMATTAGWLPQTAEDQVDGATPLPIIASPPPSPRHGLLFFLLLLLLLPSPDISPSIRRPLDCGCS